MAATLICSELDVCSCTLGGASNIAQLNKLSREFLHLGPDVINRECKPSLSKWVLNRNKRAES